MKKYIVIFLIAMMLPFATFARKKAGEMKFEHTTYNFGTIAEHGGKVQHTFEFTNTGDANLVIIDASADCGCTVPEYSSKPIAPGKSGKIRVIFDPLYRAGSFTKVITIRTNGKNKKVRIKIQGTVNPNK